MIHAANVRKIAIFNVYPLIERWVARRLQNLQGSLGPSVTKNNDFSCQNEELIITSIIVIFVKPLDRDQDG